MRPKCWIWAVALAWAGVMAGQAVGGEINWRSGRVITPAANSAVAADQVAALGRTAGDSPRKHIVVQFNGPVSSSDRQGLAAGGVTLLTYLGDHAWFAVVSAPAVQPARIAEVNKLRTALAIRPEWKLHDSLARGVIMPWALVGDDAVGPELADAAGPTIQSNGQDQRMVAAYVLFHADVDAATTGVATVAQHGGNARSHIQALNGLVVEVPYASIAALADEDAVQYIEPPLPRLTDCNDSNRQITGADAAQALPYGLDGSGITVLVFDSGNAFHTHPDLIGRVHIGDDDSVADHATHVCGTVGGDGSVSGGLRRGMAPGVMIESYGFSSGLPLEAGFLYMDPVDIEQDYGDAILNHGADISNSSIGANVASNGFPCSWEGDYGVTSALIDAMVRGSFGQPFRVVWAGGNERGNGGCGTTYNTISPPAGAKNHLSIGALYSNNDTVTTFSGWGPTDDGRIKPDFAGPGCQQGDDNGVTSASVTGAYSVKCGTSMSAPTVTGLSALFLQDFRAHYPGEPDPRNSTLKAIYAHTAVDLENPGPDYRSGYGSVRIIPAIELMRDGSFLEAELEQDGVATYSVEVLPGDPQLKVTMAWDDVPGTPNVSPALVNDLDLTVIDGSGNTYYPWTLIPAQPSLNAVRTQADHVNNIEQVVIDAPAPGYYLIRVSGFNVPFGPQAFSLAATPQLIPCTRQGSVSLDRSAYACSAIATITLNDCDINIDDQAFDSTDVLIASDSEPAGEMVTLVETEPDSARFVGTIDISSIDAPGVLQVAQGETAAVAYIDLDDGFGNLNVPVSDAAGIDCVFPAITDVMFTVINARTVQITFETSEPTMGTVRYGTACSPLNETTGEAALAVSHSIVLTDLDDDTTYHFAVDAADIADNVTSDDNGATCYSFTTPIRKEYFTERFTGDADLDNVAILFTPSGSEDGYEACRYPTLILPTDPAGGLVLPLGDSTSSNVFLAGGNQVQLYGAGYSSFFINANGNITFTAADGDSTETLEDHFDTPRVAALFDDLDPTEGGNVSWKQLADRAVITWFEVSEDSAGNRNTFQVELYYDGRIQLTYLDIAAGDGLAGLSAGGGLPADFFESDISDSQSCGPHPPTTDGQTVVLGKDREATAMLEALDDGLPASPGALTYIITSVPNQQLRDAGNDHVITPQDLPYTLVGGGSEVLYASSGGFLGQDSFTFLVNDGGTVPEGGDSNVSTVTCKVEPILTLPLIDNFANKEPNSERWSVTTGVDIISQDLSEPSSPYSARLNGTPIGGDELRSYIHDLTGLSQVQLSFYYARGGDGDIPESGENLFVEFINDAGAWQLIQQYSGEGPYTPFIFQQFDLPPEAYHEDFRLRFRNIGSAGPTNLDSWFLDNIALAIPNAPYGSAAKVNVVEDEVLEITLAGTDPNGDDLDFIISSLPAEGTLTDPGFGPIGPGALPYALPANGNVVHYQRSAAFIGFDEFTYRVNDGTYDSAAVPVTVRVEPTRELPLEDSFLTTVFDLSMWSRTDGTMIDGAGLAIPSLPYAAHFNGAPSAGDELRSLRLNLQGASNVRLTYRWQRTGSGESPDAADNLYVEYLNAADAWQQLALHTGTGGDMTTFDSANLVLPAAALHETFRLRFRNQASGGPEDDWFVDDILLKSDDAPLATSKVVNVHRFGWAAITLEASDPTNDPLSIRITDLPAAGSLYDIGDGYAPIGPADLPYELDSGTQVLYVPPFGLLGTDEFRFQASDGFYNSNNGIITLQVNAMLPAYDFTMGTDPGWTMQGQWAFGVPLGQFGDPSSGYQGNNVIGYNLAGTYTSNLPPTYLITTPLDLTYVSNARLRFRRWLGVEAAAFDQAAVEISDNGIDWSTVWQHTGGNLLETVWSLQEYDISAAADGQPNVQVRWRMGQTDGSANFAGWNLDEVAILGDIAPAFADVDSNGTVDAADFRAFALCLSGPQASPAPPAPAAAQDCLNAFDYELDGDVDLADLNQFLLLYDGQP